MSAAADAPYRYWAFISYSHADREWAQWLHRALESYRVPRRLAGGESARGPIPRRLIPIFRDRDELPSSPQLGAALNDALRGSRNLIVICSPQAAASKWVNEEVKYFKSLGRADRVFCLIVGGSPHASDKPGSGQAECFPPAVRLELDAAGEVSDTRAHPIAADAREGQDGRTPAKLKIIAGLIGVGLDELRQRERQRQFWNRLAIGAATAALLALGLTGWHWQQLEKQAALAQQELHQRIGLLYENGRRELLDHHEARAAVFLNEARKLGLDTPALRFMLARAMVPVDAQRVRINTGAPVVSVNVSPDGKRLLSMGADFKLKVWDAISGALLHETQLDHVLTTGVEFNNDGSLIWSYTEHSEGAPRRLRILDAASGKTLAQFEPYSFSPGIISRPMHPSQPRVAYVKMDRSVAVADLSTHKSVGIAGHYTAVSFCKDGKSLITGDEAGSVALRDATTGRLIRNYTGLQGAVLEIVSSDGCATLAAGSASGGVRVWNARSGETLMSGGHTQSIFDMKLTGDGNTLMSLATNGVSVWNGHTGALIYSSRFRDASTNLAMISRTGRMLATINDSRLIMLDPVSGTELYSLAGHQGATQAFEFSPDNTHFITGSADGSVAMWRLPDGALATAAFGAAADARLQLSTDPPTAPVAYARSGQKFLAGGSDGAAELWSVNPPKRLLRLPQHAAPVSAVALSADGRLAATGGWDHAIHILDAVSGRMLHEVKDAGGKIWRLEFDSSGSALSAQIEGGLEKIWDVSSASETASHARDNIGSQAFSPDGAGYAVGEGGTVTLWNRADKTKRWSTPLLAGEDNANVGVIAFSPDGSRLVVALERRSAFILDAASGKIIDRIELPVAAGLFTASFSPDSNNVAFGDIGKSLFLWRLREHTLSQLSGHTSDVRAVNWIAKGALLLSAGADGLVKIWNAADGVELYSFSADNGSIGWGDAQWNEAFGLLLTGGSDNAARLWNLHEEARSAAEVGAQLQCSVPWQLSGETLLTAALGVACSAHGS